LGFAAQWLGPARVRRLTGIAAHGAILSTLRSVSRLYRHCSACRPRGC
jgi:hypothetical protein